MAHVPGSKGKEHLLIICGAVSHPGCKQNDRDGNLLSTAALILAAWNSFSAACQAMNDILSHEIGINERGKKNDQDFP